MTLRKPARIGDSNWLPSGDVYCICYSIVLYLLYCTATVLYLLQSCLLLPQHLHEGPMPMIPPISQCSLTFVGAVVIANIPKEFHTLH
jgi:hypothetical protein